MLMHSKEQTSDRGNLVARICGVWLLQNTPRSGLKWQPPVCNVGVAARCKQLLDDLGGAKHRGRLQRRCTGPVRHIWISALVNLLPHRCCAGTSEVSSITSQAPQAGVPVCQHANLKTVSRTVLSCQKLVVAGLLTVQCGACRGHVL